MRKKGKNELMRDYLTVLWLTGARPGEVAGLTAEQVQTATNGVIPLTEHKTTHKGKARCLILTPEALSILKRRAENVGSGLVFRGRDGELTAQAIGSRMRTLCNRSGIRRLTVYGYRHTFATDALAKGLPDATVAALLGHSSTAMLHKHYSHLTARADVLRKAACRVRQPFDNSLFSEPVTIHWLSGLGRVVLRGVVWGKRTIGSVWSMSDDAIHSPAIIHRSLSMRCAIGTLLLPLTLTSLALADEKIDAAKLVGKWEDKAPARGEKFVIEFTKDDKVKLSRSVGKNDWSPEGTYKIVEGNKLTMDLKVNDEPLKKGWTITKLTDDEFTFTDDNNKKMSPKTFTKVKDK
jgi:uncharacterized protein (TIGR03066 family)